MPQKCTVLTILDCGMMHRKTGLENKIIKWLYIKLPVWKATIVTSISEETKREIVMYSNCNPQKVIVIPVAVNPQFQPFPKVFNESKPIILHIGTGYNKNLSRLISALRGIDCHLTIVGKLNDEHLDLMRANNIEYSNEYNITNERILEKYIECDILSFVSTFEGFGMPIVEANCVERVVITSNVSSMPEVANNAACLVNPLDVSDIRKGFLNIISNKEYRETLINNGRINKLRFEPTTIASMYYKLYQKVHDANINH
jgi:glycosyltransferase involved in cell wall biosynthesis